jgi:hypothetical protein
MHSVIVIVLGQLTVLGHLVLPVPNIVHHVTILLVNVQPVLRLRLR